jgi:hypothetical protein
MSGEELYRLLNSPPEPGAVWGRVSYFVRDTYASKLNNGVVPDWRTVWFLKKLLIKYMDEHKGEWAQPAELLVIKGLREAPARIQKERIYWDGVRETAKAYFSRPTPENAEKLSVALPGEDADFLDAKGEDEVVNFIMDITYPAKGENFTILTNQIEAGEPRAVDVAFNFFHFTDGAYEEILLFYIGKLVDNHPRLFLQKYLFHQKKKSISRNLDGMLTMFTEWGEIPEAGNDQAKYQQILNARIAQRIKALESVDDPELREIRDKCLSMLKKAERTESFFSHDLANLSTIRGSG